MIWKKKNLMLPKEIQILKNKQYWSKAVVFKIIFFFIKFCAKKIDSKNICKQKTQNQKPNTSLHNYWSLGTGSHEIKNAQQLLTNIIHNTNDYLENLKIKCWKIIRRESIINFLFNYFLFFFFFFLKNQIYKDHFCETLNHLPLVSHWKWLFFLKTIMNLISSNN